MSVLAIIGGGLVGASLALALQQSARQRSWQIHLIEPFAPTRPPPMIASTLMLRDRKSVV